MQTRPRSLDDYNERREKLGQSCLKGPGRMDAIRVALRNKYAWPGGYPLYLTLADGEPLCLTCARAEYKQLARATRGFEPRSPWEVGSVDINWEEDMDCVHCSKAIERAYPAEGGAA